MKIKQIYSLGVGIFIFWSIQFSSELLAQKPNYKFRSILESNGLINTTVQALYEDSYGFIWIGTHHGLQRYDGKIFTNFEKTSDSTGLSGNYIDDFCEDGDGNLWIATANGLNTYFRKSDKIDRYRWKSSHERELRNMRAGRVLWDQNEQGLIWISALNIGLIRLNIKTDSATIFRLPESSGRWVQGLMAHPFKPDKLIIGSTSIYEFDKGSGKFDEIFALEQNKNIPNNTVNDIILDPTDNHVIWCATGDVWGRGSLGGVLRFNLRTLESMILSNKTRRGEIPDVHILQICFSDHDKLWVGTRNYGALLYDLTTDKFFQYRYNEFEAGSFVTENAVRSIILDRSGTLWFGTWGDGMSVLSPALQKFKHFKHLPGKSDILADNYIMCIDEDKEGNIWIGTKAGGLNKYDPSTQTFNNYFQEFQRTGSNPNQITYLFYDSKENLWIGTYDDALYKYRPETGETTHYNKGDSPKEISQKRITAINEFVPGEILISTYGGGLNVYYYETNEFEQYVNNPSDSTSIGDNQIWLPFLGSDGNYYFGGNSVAGFIQFNPKTKKFNLPPVNRTFTTFLDVATTNDGRTFIDAISIGLAEIIIGDTVSVVSHSTKESRDIRNVESITIDKSNDLWMGTSNGLVKYDIETNKYTRYDLDDGLQGYVFTRYAGFCSSTGELYFGGRNGINIFHPDDLVLSSYKPPVVFTEFRLFQDNVEIGENSPLKQNILLMDFIELDFDQNDFSIAFAALDYSNPHKINYKYRLVNHDDDWIPNGNLAAASYTNMDPGRYTFQVMSTNADGVWNEETVSLEITIFPPWWQTTIAFIIYGILFIIGVIVVDRYQRKRLKEKARAQAREKELAQANQIRKAYDKLKTTQSQLLHSEKMASLGELTAGIAHEIQNPLNFVNNFSEVSVDLVVEMNQEIDTAKLEEVKEIATDLKQNLEKIHHHGQRASSIVKGMLEHSRAGDGNKEPTDLNAMADEYLRLAYHGIRAKDKSFNADFKADLDENLPKINIVGQDIARVVLNLINNAFYAVASKASTTKDPDYKPLVSIHTNMQDHQVEIRVKDNGGGIPADIIDKIFQPFFTTKSSGEGTGLGLSLSYDIITKGHGGELKVETQKNEGSEFIIKLPIITN